MVVIATDIKDAKSGYGAGDYYSIDMEQLAVIATNIRDKKSGYGAGGDYDGIYRELLVIQCINSGAGGDCN